MFKYLEYSLFFHNCVILPGLGGFIINSESTIDSDIKPLKLHLVFNPELNHDDGIIASYIVRDDKISYNAALQRIKDTVKDIKADLRSGQIIKCANLGELFLDREGNISFVANRNFVYPSFWGLTSVDLPLLVDIKETSQKETKRLFLRNIAGVAAAAVAAIFLFIGPSANISTSDVNKQQAGFVQLLTSNSNHTIVSADSLNIKSVQPQVDEKTNASTRVYYIIVGGEDSKSRAERLLEKIKGSGFQNAAIVESGDRYRIYVASFTDKAESESYLEKFRKENPQYATAWLYSKRRTQ